MALNDCFWSLLLSMHMSANDADQSHAVAHAVTESALPSGKRVDQNGMSLSPSSSALADLSDGAVSACRSATLRFSASSSAFFNGFDAALTDLVGADRLRDDTQQIIDIRFVLVAQGLGVLLEHVPGFLESCFSHLSLVPSFVLTRAGEVRTISWTT